MVEVNLWSGLRRVTDGQTVVAVQAETLQQMLEALVAAHPGLAPYIRAGVSVSVNGVIVTDLLSPVDPGDEIYLMQYLKGG